MSLIPAINKKFTNANIALQENLIRLIFPLAIDRNYPIASDPTLIDYELRYSYQPIYCQGNEDEYIYLDPAEKRYSSWVAVTSLLIDPLLPEWGQNIQKLSSHNTDVEIIYSIRAKDSYLPESSWPIISFPPIYSLVNKPAEISILSVDWSSEEGDIDVHIQVDNFGLSNPGNYYNITSENEEAWVGWKEDIATYLGNINFVFTYIYENQSYLLNVENREATTKTFNLLNEALIPGSTFKTTLSTIIEGGDNKFLPTLSYYMQFFLEKNNINPTSNTILNNELYLNSEIVFLLNRLPVLQIKKGRIKINMPEEKNIFTGGGIFSHGPHVKSKEEDPEEGRTIALYDHHTLKGTDYPQNKPSIGFFDTEHNELGYLQAEEDVLKTNFNITTTGDLNIAGDLYEKGEKLSNRYLLQENSIFNIKQEEFISTANQKTFSLTTGEFDPNTNKLNVYIYGVRQPNTAFTEASDGKSFSMIKGLEAGDRVLAEWIESVNIAGFIRTTNLIQTYSYDSNGDTIVTFNDGSSIKILRGIQGEKGSTGAGFTGGSYNSQTGQVTFLSADGLGFTTGDLRGEISGFVNGGKPWSFQSEE